MLEVKKEAPESALKAEKEALASGLETKEETPASSLEAEKEAIAPALEAKKEGGDGIGTRGQ